MRTVPNTFGVFAVRARARSIGYWVLNSVHIRARCISASWPVVFRARARQASIVFFAIHRASAHSA